jgi:hypothetical protein
MKLLAMIIAGLMAAAAFGQTTVVLQQGLNGYTGCEDKELRDPSRNYGNGPNQNILLINEY